MTSAEGSTREQFFGQKHVTIIRSTSGFSWINARELWAYRELLVLLAWRDVSVRYKQSLVGITWALLQPALMTLIFSVVFGQLAHLPSDGLPYPLFAFCGLLPWNYFARSLGDSSDALVSSSHLVTKVYFPRLILPLSKVFAGLVDLLAALVVMAALMASYHVLPTIRIAALPFFVLIAMVTSLGAGLWFTALNVKYRDVKFIVPFVIQCWMYGSPVAYATSLVPPEWQWVYALNPMVGVIEGFRWALLGTAGPSDVVAPSLAITTILLFSGLMYFKRVERTFADII